MKATVDAAKQGLGLATETPSTADTGKLRFGIVGAAAIAKKNVRAMKMLDSVGKDAMRLQNLCHITINSLCTCSNLAFRRLKCMIIKTPISTFRWQSWSNSMI